MSGGMCRHCTQTACLGHVPNRRAVLRRHDRRRARGPGVAAYTGVLIADTAVPVWHDAYRELPLLFMGSATGAAGGLGLIGTPTPQGATARRAVLFGAELDLAVTKRMYDRLGMAGEPLHTGTAGWLLRAARVLTFTRAVVGRLSRVASADDPKYTVVPQRGTRYDGVRSAVTWQCADRCSGASATPTVPRDMSRMVSSCRRTAGLSQEDSNRNR